VGIWLSIATYSGVGLAAIPLVLLLAVDQGFPRRRSQLLLTASRRVTQDRALCGEPVLVELVISNRGQDLERVTVEDQLPQGIRVTRGSTLLMCRLAKGEATTLRYEARVDEPKRIRFESCIVRVKSTFGLTESRVTLPAPAAMTIYPRLLARRVTVGRAKAYSWAGSSPSRFKGGRLDFMNIRSHVSSDPVRDINWKASARLGKKLVNEWHAERGLDCILVVDLSSEDMPRVGEWTARSDVITCSYELAHSLVASGNRVGMLVLGSTISRIRPGFGMRHLRLMLDTLVSAGEGWVWRLEHLEELLRISFRRQYRLRGGTLFFVTAGPNMPLFEVLRLLSAKGFSLNCVFVNTVEQETVELKSRRMVAVGGIERGAKFAEDEMRWFEKQYAMYSKVFEWNKVAGFVETEVSLR